eukprot:COSAG01_NODE_1248_length_11071_cov_30.622676_7_plen_195_part_00
MFSRRFRGSCRKVHGTLTLTARRQFPIACRILRFSVGTDPDKKTSTLPRDRPTGKDKGPVPYRYRTGTVPYRYRYRTATVPLLHTVCTTGGYYGSRYRGTGRYRPVDPCSIAAGILADRNGRHRRHRSDEATSVPVGQYRDWLLARRRLPWPATRRYYRPTHAAHFPPAVAANALPATGGVMHVRGTTAITAAV